MEVGRAGRLPRRPPAGTAPRRGGADVKEPHRIDANNVYTLQTAQEALALAKGCLPRECRLGRLWYCKRGGKVFFLGTWLLEWLRAGEVRRRQVAAAAGGARP